MRQNSNNISRSALMDQNPILHLSNRVCTSGLLSGYSNRHFTTQTIPLRHNEMGREWITDVPLMPMGEKKPTQSFQREPDAVDEDAVEQPQFYLYERYHRKQHAVRFSYSTTMKSVFIDYARKIEDSSITYDKYDWSNKTSFRATLSDLGSLLTVLSGNESQVAIEKNMNDEVHLTISLAKAQENNTTTFTIHCNKKVHGKEEDKAYVKVAEADAILLTEFVRCAVRRGLGFN